MRSTRAEGVTASGRRGSDGTNGWWACVATEGLRQGRIRIEKGTDLSMKLRWLALPALLLLTMFVTGGATAPVEEAKFSWNVPALTVVLPV